MGSSSGPRLKSRSDLLLALDASDFPNSAMPLGCGGFNGSNQGMRSNVNGLILQFTNGLRLTGREYYTGFAIDYPEGSYGGDAANRQGLTPGYDVRSGGKTYDASRALHMWVRNVDTNSWISGYFRGFRLGGHCYDNYSGAENGYNTELTLFAEDYNTVKSTFPNAIFIIAGSHRADRYNSTVRNILYDLGMPTGYLDSDYIAAPEWILVGKPGLGAGKAYGWVYENYTTNPNQVAHINFGLPLKGVKSTLEFDGSNDYLAHPSPSSLRMGTQNFTLETVIRQSDTGYHGLVEARGDSLVGYLWILNYGTAGGMATFLNYGGNQYVHFQNGGFNVTSTSQFYHLATVVDRSQSIVQFYINGVQAGSNVSLQHAQSISPSGGDYYHVGWDRGGSPFSGEMVTYNHYNKALSSQEIAQNYANYRTRFNLP